MLLCDGGKDLWLKSRGMNAIRVQTFHDNFCLFGEVLDGSIVNHYMCRCNSFPLIEAPDVKLVYRLNSRNLSIVPY